MPYRDLEKFIANLSPKLLQRVQQGFRIELSKAEAMLLEFMLADSTYSDQQIQSLLQQRGIRTGVRTLRSRTYRKILDMLAHILLTDGDSEGQLCFDLWRSRIAFVHQQDRVAMTLLQQAQQQAELLGEPVHQLLAQVMLVEYDMHRDHQLLDEQMFRRALDRLQALADQTQRFARLLHIRTRVYDRYYRSGQRDELLRERNSVENFLAELQQVPVYVEDNFLLPFLRWSTEALLHSMVGNDAGAVQSFTALLEYFWHNRDKLGAYAVAYLSTLQNQIAASAAAYQPEVLEQCFEALQQFPKEVPNTPEHWQMVYIAVCLYLAVELGAFAEVFQHREVISQVLQRYRRNQPYLYKISLFHLGSIAFWLEEYEAAQHYFQQALEDTSQLLMQQVEFWIRLLRTLVLWEQQEFEALERALKSLRAFVRQYPDFVPLVRIVRRILLQIPTTFVADAQIKKKFDELFRRLLCLLRRQMADTKTEFDILGWLEARFSGQPVEAYYRQKRRQEWEERAGRLPHLVFNIAETVAV